MAFNFLKLAIYLSWNVFKPIFKSGDISFKTTINKLEHFVAASYSFFLKWHSILLWKCNFILSNLPKFNCIS